jgi:hypothetical protein
VTSLPRALNGKYLKNIILAFGKILKVRKWLIMVLLSLAQKIADETP